MLPVFYLPLVLSLLASPTYAMNEDEFKLLNTLLQLPNERDVPQRKIRTVSQELKKETKNLKKLRKIAKEVQKELQRYIINVKDQDIMVGQQGIIWQQLKEVGNGKKRVETFNKTLQKIYDESLQKSKLKSKKEADEMKLLDEKIKFAQEIKGNLDEIEDLLEDSNRTITFIIKIGLQPIHPRIKELKESNRGERLEIQELIKGAPKS